MAAHRPEKILGLAETDKLGPGEHVLVNQLFASADTVIIFRDPEQRLQIAQAAFAFLDIRLDQIARLALARMALIAFGKLCMYEFG